MSRPVEVAPSILSADFSRLGEQISLVMPHSGRIHADVMDGHFVPNLTIGPVVVASIRPITAKPIEVHLMVTEPDRFIEPFVEAGADRLIFHVEAEGDPASTCAKIRSHGVAAGLALNPETPWEQAEPFLREVDLVIVMTVNPGFGGQGFLEPMLDKVHLARSAVGAAGLDIDIEVDGGINPQTARRARDAGANVFVAGHAIFRQSDPALAASEIAAVLEVDKGNMD